MQKPTLRLTIHQQKQLSEMIQNNQLTECLDLLRQASQSRFLETRSRFTEFDLLEHLKAWQRVLTGNSEEQSPEFVEHEEHKTENMLTEINTGMDSTRQQAMPAAVR